MGSAMRAGHPDHIKQARCAQHGAQSPHRGCAQRGMSASRRGALHPQNQGEAYLTLNGDQSVIAGRCGCGPDDVQKTHLSRCGNAFGNLTSSGVMPPL
jgi:hypothetical protein